MKIFNLLSVLAIGLYTTHIEAQTIPFTFTGTSPITFREDANGQLFSIGVYDTTNSTYNLNSLATGAGARLLWYPSKAAFRAGYVNGTQWDEGQIGPGSAAFGINNTVISWNGLAAGDGNTCNYSSNEVTLGGFNTAYGDDAVAIGIVNTSDGNFTETFGANNQALGYYSSAIGEFSYSLATCSNSFGYADVAFCDYSVAIGSQSAAQGNYSTVVGNGLCAGSRGETVVGSFNVNDWDPNGWLPTDYIFVVGNGQNTSARSNALTITKAGNMTVQGVITAAAGGDIPMYTGN